MSAPSKPMKAGDLVACYTIIAIKKDAPSAAHRRYWAKANCCGLIIDRAEHSLLDARRAGAEMCHRCARQKANLNLAASYGFHERFGPVKVIDRGEEPKTWRVVWDCCGKESTIGQAYLNQLKVFWNEGRTTVCLECSIKRSRKLTKEREKPTRQSLTKAKILPLPALAVVAPLPPLRPLHDCVILTPEAAQLPIGIIPAAIAWPRPGARA